MSVLKNIGWGLLGIIGIAIASAGFFAGLGSFAGFMLMLLGEDTGMPWTYVAAIGAGGLAVCMLGVAMINFGFSKGHPSTGYTVLGLILAAAFGYLTWGMLFVVSPGIDSITLAMIWFVIICAGGFAVLSFWRAVAHTRGNPVRRIQPI